MCIRDSSEAGLKVEKVGGVVGGGTECGESVEELADKARRSLDIFFGEEGGTAVSE